MHVVMVIHLIRNIVTVKADEQTNVTTTNIFAPCITPFPAPISRNLQYSKLRQEYRASPPQDQIEGPGVQI